MTHKRKKVNNHRLVKAPQAPRRNRSAYMFFSAVKHKELRLDPINKKAPTTHISKLISKAWKALSTEKRQVYLDMAAKDHLRYKEEKQTYKGPWTVNSKTEAPVQPPSNFFLYMQSVRPELRKTYPEMDGDDLTRLIAKNWKEAPASVRRPFQNEANKLRQQYHRDIALWQSQQGSAMRSSAQTSLDLSEHFSTTSLQLSHSFVVRQQMLTEKNLSTTLEMSYNNSLSHDRNINTEPLTLHETDNDSSGSSYTTIMADNVLTLDIIEADRWFCNEMAMIQQAALYIPNMDNCSPIDDSFIW